MAQEIAVIISGPPLAPQDDAPGPSTSSSGGASTSLGLVEREYVIQPNTIIEVVDLYVPPAHSEFRIPIFQPPDGAVGPNSAAQSIRGRRRGRPPLGTRPSGVSTRKPYKRRTRMESPPPLPPVPNYLSHVINPLENEIYPKVIVLPARLPFVIPKNLNEDPPMQLPPPPPPRPQPPPPQPQPPAASPAAAASNQPQSQSHLGNSANDTAQLHENLKLFGPNVANSQVTSDGQSPHFMAVHKKPSGEKCQILLSASQLQAFVASGGADEVPVQPPPPKRIIVEPPPNFRLPTMAALRAAAHQNARRGDAAAGSLGGVGMGLGMRVAGKPQARPTPAPTSAPANAPLIIKVPANVWAKAQEQAAAKEAAKKDNTAASGSVPSSVQATASVQGPPPAATLTSASISAPVPAAAPAKVQTLSAAEALPPLASTVPLELSRSRVPSILTRKSQLRLFNERAKRAAEKVGGDAQKQQQTSPQEERKA